MSTPVPSDVKPQATGGWCWRRFGDALMLVTETGGSQVVLAAAHRPMPEGIYTRDPKTGLLRLLQADDAAACLIEAAPDLLAKLRTAVSHIEHMAAWIGNRTGGGVGYSFESLDEDMPDIRAAIAKAERAT